MSSEAIKLKSSLKFVPEADKSIEYSDGFVNDVDKLRGACQTKSLEVEDKIDLDDVEMTYNTLKDQYTERSAIAKSIQRTHLSRQRAAAEDADEKKDSNPDNKSARRGQTERGRSRERTRKGKEQI